MLAIIGVALAVGLLGGLRRIGWSIPTVALERVSLHGPILLAGVFGTLIALERAVAMRTVLGPPWTAADLAPISDRHPDS